MSRVVGGAQRPPRPPQVPTHSSPQAGQTSCPAHRLLSRRPPPPPSPRPCPPRPSPSQSGPPRRHQSSRGTGEQISRVPPRGAVRGRGLAPLLPPPCGLSAGGARSPPDRMAGELRPQPSPSPPPARPSTSSAFPTQSPSSLTTPFWAQIQVRL